MQLLLALLELLEISLLDDPSLCGFSPATFFNGGASAVAAFGVTDTVAVVVIPLVFASRLSDGLLLLPLRPALRVGLELVAGFSNASSARLDISSTSNLPRTIA